MAGGRGGRPSYDLIGAGYVVEDTVQENTLDGEEPRQKKRFRCAFEGCGQEYAPLTGGRIPASKFIAHFAKRCKKIPEVPSS